MLTLILLSIQIDLKVFLCFSSTFLFLEITSHGPAPGPLYLLFLCLECFLPSYYDSSFSSLRSQLPREAVPDHSHQKLQLSFCYSP